MKNTGKPSEKIFDDYVRSLGKRAFVFAFTDSAEATGRNKKMTAIKAQPADRIVVNNGVVSFCEVKSTWHERLFEFKLLRSTQSAYARMILAAGGSYNVYIHALHLGRWFCVPYSFINWHKDAGKASIPWAQLGEFSCSLT